MIAVLANHIFDQAIADYHKTDNIDHPVANPFPKDAIEFLLYQKCWIDTVQWHMEDEVRNPNIAPLIGLEWKRRIDQSNQERTDMVERIDDHFLEKYGHISLKADARINTESPAWAIDRLSILALKIYHMLQETWRSDASEEHKQNCQRKLDILLEQRADLSNSVDELLTDIAQGNKRMKVYRQMKMYNDPSLNPVLYDKAKKQ